MVVLVKVFSIIGNCATNYFLEVQCSGLYSHLSHKWAGFVSWWCKHSWVILRKFAKLEFRWYDL